MNALVRTGLGALAVCAVLACGSGASAEPPDDEEATTAEADAPAEADPEPDSEPDSEPDPEAGRDIDAMFGDDEDDENEDDENEDGESEDGEGGLIEAGLDLVGKLEGLDDILQIGGLLYMRLDWFTRSEGDIGEFPLMAPSLVDLYLDVRPSDRIRAYIRGRVRHDFTAGGDSVDPFGQPVEATQVDLDQLWLKFDIARRVFVTLGRQPIKWGSGRFWNPTDFLNPTFRDPLAVFDERLGVSLIKLHVPVEALNWNIYGVVDLEGVNGFDDIGGALRGEFLFGNTELAVSFAGRKDTPLRFGASVSTGFWWIDASLEVALLYDVPQPRWEGNLDLETFELPTARDVSDVWWPRLSAGLEISVPYGDDDAMFIGMEYAYNALGYDDPALYPWLAAQGQLQFLWTGRHYAALGLVFPSPGQWDEASLSVSTIGNLSDMSFLSRFDMSVQILTYLTLNTYFAVHYGRTGELRYSVKVPAVPGVEGLEDGINVAAPLIDIGVGLRLRL